MEQESEWTSPYTVKAIPLSAGKQRSLSWIDASSGSTYRHVDNSSDCWRVWVVICSVITFILGACTAGLLVLWKYEHVLQEQEQHIHELRDTVEGLMTRPMSETEAHTLGKSAYVQELYCKQVWRKEQFGASISPAALDGRTHAENDAPSAAPVSGCVQTCALQQQEPERSDKRWAYVMMSYNQPGNAEHLWGVVAVAGALRRLKSLYPLVVLTNTSLFPDGTDVAKALHRLNVILQPVYKVDMPAKHQKKLMYQHWKIAYWKLQIWNLAQFEKLIWLDSDTILYRNMDWLFQRPWMWAQRDDWFCKLNMTKVCSGIMLLYPNTSDFKGMLQHAEDMDDLTDGDQQLISSYFAVKRKRAISLLSDLEAAFGQCIGKPPAPYINRDGSAVWGIWNMPSFVHKSGGWGNTNDNLYSNVCFMPNMTMQLYNVGGATLNVCQFHPLGPYWRRLFCDAIAIMGVRLERLESFCDDECWYSGKRQLSASHGSKQHPSCGAINGTLSYMDYYRRTVGYPPAEAPTLIKQIRL
eukprot:CAMPEP_0172685352 /NCGR_PEP_ID=MMETSP1074-20121228/20175_1 /TAXON_ID=2916 /ORGANISM="Ceratium fusus, Strain PA161109" /LENGTH=524 /DNA_ID=CAMNT_0013504479 /DNA_START=139 /DNA_END=1713 /DNA_ORIENTATION=+